MMTALLLARYNSFNSGALLTNLAYDVALSIRQAQTYGVSVLSDPNNTSPFNSSYGVMFDVDNPTQFSIYSDNINFGKYLQYDITKYGSTNAPNINTINTYNLKQGSKVQGFCVFAEHWNKNWCTSNYDPANPANVGKPTFSLGGSRESSIVGWARYRLAIDSHLCEYSIFCSILLFVWHCLYSAGALCSWN